MTEFIVKIAKSQMFDSLPFLFKSIFSGCKALSYASSDHIIFFQKKKKWRFSPNVHRAKGDRLVRASVLPVCAFDNVTLTSQKPRQHNNKCDCSKTNGYNFINNRVGDHVVSYVTKDGSLAIKSPTSGNVLTYFSFMTACIHILYSAEYGLCKTCSGNALPVTDNYFVFQQNRVKVGGIDDLTGSSAHS